MKLIWKPFETQFGQQMDSFRDQTKIVEKEVGLSHMIEAAESRAEIRAHQQQLSKARYGMLFFLLPFISRCVS